MASVSNAERVALQQAGQYAGRRGQDILTPENAPDVGLLPERGFVARGVPDSQPQIPAPPEVLESRTDPSSGILLGPSTLQPGDTQEKPSPVAPMSNIIDSLLGQPGRLESTMKRLQPDQPKDEQNKEPGKIKIPGATEIKEDTPSDSTSSSKEFKVQGATEIKDQPAASATPATPQKGQIQVQGATEIPEDQPTTQQPSTSPSPTIPLLPQPTAPQGQPTDQHDRVAALIAQGLTPGQAWAVAAGLIPKTLAGNTPPPPLPPPPKAEAPPTSAPPAQPPKVEAPPTEPSQPSQPTTTYIAPPLIHGKAPIGSNLPSTQPAPPAAPSEQPSSEQPQKPSDLQPAAVAQPPAAKPVVTVMPAIEGSYTPSTDRSIKGIVIHSSDGNEKSDINTLTGHDPSHRVSSHYYVTKDGRIYQFVADGDIAWHAGQTSGKYAGYNNADTIGIEQEHVDGQPWSEAEVKATARLTAYLQKKYGLSNGNTLGHSDVAPERKQDPYNYPWDRFHQYVQDAGGASDKGGPAALASASPLSKEDAGAVDLLHKAGLNVTRFGYQGDSTPDPDSAKGNGKWVQGMKPGYDVALNNAAWELVGRPKPGSVFHYAGRDWRYGDQVPERYSDARFDIYDKDGQFASIGGDGGGKASGSKGGSKTADTNAPAPSPEISLPGGGESPAPLGYSGGGSSGRGGGGGGSLGGGGGAPSNVGDISIYPGGGGGGRSEQRRGGRGEESAPPKYQPQQMSAQDITPEENPLIAALMKRGFTPQQAQNFAQSSANVASAKGLPPINVKGPPPAAPGLPPPSGTTLSLAQPTARKPIQIAPIKPGKSFVLGKGTPPAAPGRPTRAPMQLTGPPTQQAQPQQAQAPKVDPSVVLGLMKRGFSREQAMAVASKATVSKGIGETASFRPPAAAPPAKPPQQPQAPPVKPPSDLPQPKPQPVEEPAAFTGRPPGSTHGNPNPPGMEALAGKITQQAKHHASVLSPDDPRVKKQADGFVKGEHFVEGDPFHDQMLEGLPYGKQGRQRGLLREAETAIADKSPMHISYISAPKEAAKFPTRETRTTQYDEHSPEARLMGTTEGQLVGHSFIPLAAGVKLSTKAGEPHQSYVQGISTNVMANNFQHVNDKLQAMGRKSPYKEMGAKFQNDLEGYYSNLLAGHTATGRGYVAGTEHHPMDPDREHVPYKLSRKEADFIGTVINNTAAFAKHDDAKAIRELARINGSLITEKGETNRMRHDIEEHEPGWRERVLEPTIRSFKTGLIHEIHPTEEHMPMEIRPGKHYQSLTKSIARTSERGRPDIAIAAGLHHNFEDNRKINQIERDFSDHKIDEAEARNRIKALGEDPDEYRFVGGSGGLITPYEEDPEALTPEEHDTMKNNLRQAWVGGKMNVEDYRKKAAEVPLPQKPSKAVPAPKPAPKLPESKTPEPSASLPVETPEAPPIPKPVAPKPPKPPKPKAPPKPEPEDIETPPAAPSAPPKPEETKQLDPSRVKNQYAASGDKVHWMPTDEVDKRWKARDESSYIPPGGTKNTIQDRYPKAQEHIQSDKPVNAPRAEVNEEGNIGIIDGRHRLAAMRDLGHTHVPLALVTHAVTGAEESAANAKKTGLMGSSEAPATPPAPDEPLPPVKKKPKAAKAAPETLPEAPKATGQLEKPSWKTANEKTRQAYLKQRVAHDMERQYKGADAHQLEVDRNEEDNSIKYDPAGNPIYKKIDYDLANSPLLKKKGLSQIKDADEHPDTLGNLIGPDGKEVIDPDTGKPVLKHTHLNQVERSRLSAMHTASAVHTMGNKIVDEFMKIKDQPEIMAGEGWYSRMRKKLADALGEHHELFAQLLGATSAKTPVRNNFIQSLDALEQFKQGKFDNHIKKYQEAFEKMREGKGALVQHMKNQAIPLYDKDGNAVETHDTDAAAMANWIHHHGILPRQQIQEGQEEGSKYNANSVAVLRALAGTWLKEIGAPKTPNFAGNLTGRTLEATIDVWAARFLKRLGYEGHGEGPWRSQGKSEPGVNSLDFAFSQDAMRHAADEITKRTGKKMNPDDLQAIAWFAEKHHWEKQGWTRGAGAEKSSFDDVADLAFPKTGEPMTSADLRKHYAAIQAEAKRVKARVKTAKNYVGHADPKMRAKLEPYMEKHGLTHEQVHGPEVEEEGDEDEAA